jgi:PAS domain S-box-containing protein
MDASSCRDYDRFSQVDQSGKSVPGGRKWMSEPQSLLIFVSDTRLAPLAMSDNPAWLWSADASRVLWSNAAAAVNFDADSPATLIGRAIDPGSPAALEILRLAGTLRNGAAPRLERLRGFGGRFGGLLTCGCSRIELADQRPAILVVSTEASGPPLSLTERARHLLSGCQEPAALFTVDGSLLHATATANARLGNATDIRALGAASLGATAMAAGHVTGNSNAGTISIARIGSGPLTALLATFAPASAESTGQTVPTPTAPPSRPTIPLEVPPSSQASAERRPPLRFVWQMDVEGRLSIDSDEFVMLVGPQTIATLGKPWGEAANSLVLDPDGQVARALASRNTWSGITVAFPADNTNVRLAVELSGLPVFDRDRNFQGYRGFGICRDTARVAELMELRRSHPSTSPRVEPPVFRNEQPAPPTTPVNVVPFRTSTPDESTPTLTPIEREAFSELADRLSARLRNRGKKTEHTDVIEPPEEIPPPESRPQRRTGIDTMAGGQGINTDQRPILDRLPLGVLVYRLDKLIYANRAFLDWTGYEDLYALEQAGGLDALFVEPSNNDAASQEGAKALSIATNRGDQLPIEARLITSLWQGESALVLILTGGNSGKPSDTEPRVVKAGAGELRAVLDAVADGIVVVDREGCVLSLNSSAEALFGYDSFALIGQPLSTLVAPESQRDVLECLSGLSHTDISSMPKGSHEVIGRRRDGGLVSLSMTIGRIAGDGDRRCAVVRDMTQWKKTEAELLHAKRQAEVRSSAKSEFLAKISHEIRTPLNAIIGFSEVMMQERFGPIGNERYRQYLKDIHSSGDHLVSLLNDLLDLSKIEAGKLELSFAELDLNDLTQQCVALMQPQANRQRIIIRTSLMHKLPPIIADPRSVRQIVLNLLSNSIKFTETGGQVIVSTALDDGGVVVLRVRDTGVGMSEQDLAIALEPFRQLATAARWGSGGTGLGLPLSKALAEANRASFRIKSAVNTGTLVEVAFSGHRLAAE